jgi:aminoglycoside phosphotransferase (APT) family kinase protein
MAWCVFNLQDSVLIGVRRAVFVPAENLAYSLAKIALLVALAGVAPHYGIFASWTAALAVSLVPVNILIFRRLLPWHAQSADGRLRAPTRRQLARFVSADYVGALFWLAATTLMPVIVVALEGATANAYFALAWMIGAPLYAVSGSTGASLVVTASRDERGLPRYAGQALIQTAGIVIPLALALALAAPIVLRLFGGAYSQHGATTLSLVALAAIPNAMNALYVSVYRVRRKMSAVVALLGSLCGLVLGLAVVFLKLFGIAGVGLAWLVAESVVAAALLIIEPRALWPSRDSGRRVAFVRDLAADLGVLDVLVRLRHGRADRKRARDASRVALEVLDVIPAGPGAESPVSWVNRVPFPTVSDVIVMTAGPHEEPPRAVIKLPQSAGAVRSLRREREVLAALREDARLGDWRQVLPTTLAEGEVAGQTYVVERMLPGVAAARSLGRATDHETRQLLTAAVSAIGELHERTATQVTVDGPVLERWVDRPALVVGRAHAGADATSAAIERVVGGLHEALEGRTLPASWVHGDFVPSNVLVSPDRATVVGIVDWDQAGPADLPSIDVVSLLLSARVQRRRRELGQVVRGFLTGAPWTEPEQVLLDSTAARLPGAQVDARTLVLLWWLRHVASNLAKSTRYNHDGFWARWNIQVVLETLRRP